MFDFIYYIKSQATIEFLLVLCATLGHTYPVSDQGLLNQSEVIFVPFDVKYVPIEVPASVSQQELEKVLNPQSKEVSAAPASIDQTSIPNLELLKEKFDVDETKNPEDYVLVPVALLESLEATKSTDKHSISKRQAPGFQRRLRRPRPLVGYLNNYDQFPTVA